MQSYSVMNRLLQLAIYILVILFLSGCKPPVQEQEEKEPDQISEEFIRVNQYMQQRHQDQISAFLERVGWKAEVTPSGLWIVVKKPGEGKRIRENDHVTYAFESTLLDGTPCYSAPVEHPKEIVIGQGGVESGVEQGLKRLRDGAEAVFFIPPHLAHGNFGDRDKIPGNSVLIYTVHVLKVE
jgi:FKBP-type peptidyl-prolyl cis-trans isomerase FkpA